MGSLISLYKYNYTRMVNEFDQQDNDMNTGSDDGMNDDGMNNDEDENEGSTPADDSGEENM